MFVFKHYMNFHFFSSAKLRSSGVCATPAHPGPFFSPSASSVSPGLKIQLFLLFFFFIIKKKSPKNPQSADQGGN